MAPVLLNCNDREFGTSPSEQLWQAYTAPEPEQSEYSGREAPRQAQLSHTNGI
jgi:hypothetical protein